MRGRASAFCPLLLAVAVGCSHDQPDVDLAPCEPAPTTGDPNQLRLAGSGTTLAPIARIAGLFERAHAGRRVRIAQSIGTGGAIRALADRAIDVGLASRALSAEERALGITAHPFARVALSPTVHQRVPREALGMSSADLARIYRGDMSRWPDGTAIVPILRQPGDSAMHAIAASSPELDSAMRAARKSGRALIRYTDQEVRDTLLDVPGAIGFLDVGTVALEELPLRALGLDGVPATAGSAGDGRYPLVLTLSLLTLDDAPEAARAFVRFATSSDVAAALAPARYAPAQTETQTPGGP